jgi:hypothetical protein
MVAHFVKGLLNKKYPQHSHYQFELRMLLDNPSDTAHTHVMMTSPIEALHDT